ncbi:hypothetical protein KXD40_006344 [Peronospora effusa]|nr:hypothetical protein KXD40_006344 [Peronospora effusa]
MTLPLSLLKTAQGHPMDGDRFWKMPECYIRGNTIKYIRVPNELLDMVHEEDFNKRGTFFYVALLRDSRVIVKHIVDVAVEVVVALVVEEAAVAGVDVVDVGMALVAEVDVEIARVAEVDVVKAVAEEVVVVVAVVAATTS